MEKKPTLLKCGFRAFGAYTVINFLWTAILSIGLDVAQGNKESVAPNLNGMSEFADRLVMVNAVIALFSVVFGFSFLVFEIKNMSSQAKRALHIAINYIVSVICVCIIFSTTPDANASGWVVLIFFATLAFFIIYGVSGFVSFLVKRNKTR